MFKPAALAPLSRPSAVRTTGLPAPAANTSELVVMAVAAPTVTRAPRFRNSRLEGEWNLL
jgi:hypothetical protein